MAGEEQVFRIDIIIDPSNAKQGSKEVEQGLESVENKAKSLNETLRAALGVLALGIGLKELGSLSDEYVTLQNRIRGVIDSEEELDSVTERLSRISEQTRGSFSATAALFSRFKTSTLDLGRSQEEVLGLTEDLNKILTISGQTAGSASGAITALSIAFQNGTLEGRALRSLLTDIPLAARLIAKELGVTTQQLKEMANAGKITGDVIIDAFANSRQEIEERYGKTIPTIGQAFEDLHDSVLKTVGQLSETSGAGQAAAEAIQFLARNVDVLLPVLAGLATMIGVTLAKSAIGLLLTQLSALSLVLLANPWILVAAAIGGVVTAVVQLANKKKELHFALAETATDLEALRNKADDVAASHFRVLNPKDANDDKAAIKAIEDELKALEEALALVQQTGTAALSDDTISKLLPGSDLVARRRKAIEEAAKLDRDSLFIPQGSISPSTAAKLFLDGIVPEDEIIAGIKQRFQRLTETLSKAKATARLADPKEIAEGKKQLAAFFEELAQQQELARARPEDQDRLSAEIEATSLAAKAGVRSLEEYAAIIQSVRDEYQAINLAKGESAIRDFRQGLEDENEVLRAQAAAVGQGSLAMKQNIAVVQLEQALRKLGIKLRDDEIAGIRAQVAAEERLRQQSQGGPQPKGNISAEQFTLFQDAKDPLLDFHRQVADLDALLKSGEITNEEYAKSFDELAVRGLASATSIEDGFTRTFASIRLEAANEAKVVGDVFGVLADLGTSAIDDLVHNSGDGFRKLAVDALHAIEQIIIRLLLMKAIAAIGGNAGGAVSAVTGALGLGGGSGETASAASVPYHADTATVSSLSAPPQQQVGQGQAQPAPQVNVRVVNVSDPNEVSAALNSGSLDVAVMNVLARNRHVAKRTLA